MVILFFDTSGKFSKLSEIIFEIFQIDLILKIFGNNSRSFTKLIFLDIYQNFSKPSKIIFDIVLTSRTRVCIASHSVLERIEYGYIVHSVQWHTSHVMFCGLHLGEPTLLFVITLVSIITLSVKFHS